MPGVVWIDIEIKQFVSGGLAEGRIRVPLDAIDWYGEVNGRQTISVRGEKFMVKDPEKLTADIAAADE